ncbi:MAG: hypothetical protein IH989_01400 [Planctomycetes bacterium]|nr:hypothetical protein [Planctomycetota bacterium]
MLREWRIANSEERIQNPEFAILASTRRLIAAKSLLLLSLPLLAPGCGNDLGTEVAGILIEEFTFAVQFELTGQPVCQGPPSRCGPPGLFALIIPDCPLGVVCFGEACNTHDRCYGTCGTSKVVCDDLFLDTLLDTCWESTPDKPALPVSLAEDDETFERCVSLAYIYWQAVARFGQIAFAIAQDVNCACLGVTPNPAPTAKQFSTASPEFYPYDDLDDDLMPDEWERVVGLDPDNAGDAGEDPDADGILNLEEFILGSNPFAADPYYARRDGT